MARKRGDSVTKLRAVLRLGRPVNAVMVFIAVIIGGFLGGLRLENVLLPALSATLISMGAQAVNDYFDVEVDKRRGRKRPLVDGTLTLKEAKLVWMLYFSLGLLLAALSSPLHFTVALIAAILSYLYSSRIQSRKYVGNVVVSLLVALSVVYGAIGGKIDNAVLPAIMMFLVNWGREIYKDITDGDADYPRKISLYHVLTKQWAGFLASYLVFLGVVLTPFPYLMGHVGTYYVPAIAVASLVALYGVAKSLKDDYQTGERMVKFGMIIALIAFLVGAVL